MNMSNVFCGLFYMTFVIIMLCFQSCASIESDEETSFGLVNCDGLDLGDVNMDGYVSDKDYRVMTAVGFNYWDHACPNVCDVNNNGSFDLPGDADALWEIIK